MTQNDELGVKCRDSIESMVKKCDVITIYCGHALHPTAEHSFDCNTVRQKIAHLKHIHIVITH